MMDLFIKTTMVKVARNISIFTYPAGQIYTSSRFVNEKPFPNVQITLVMRKCCIDLYLWYLDVWMGEEQQR